jgi:hypothetical protein
MGLQPTQGHETHRSSQICHLNRSEAEWRDLRFLLSSHAVSEGPIRFLGLLRSVSATAHRHLVKGRQRAINRMLKRLPREV